jgi:hypothetical protein
MSEKKPNQNSEPLTVAVAYGLNEHITDIIFERKEDFVEAKNLTLEEQVLNYSNEVLGIKAMSVALPPNYSPEPKTEEQIMNWLRNTIHNRHSSAYALSLKHGEKSKIKLDQKKPYSKN